MAARSPADDAYVIHPMQYELERTYHRQREDAALRDRQVLDAEQQIKPAQSHGLERFSLGAVLRTKFTLNRRTA